MTLPSSAIGGFIIGVSPIGVLPANVGFLEKYLQQTQRILGDEKEQRWNRFDLAHYINTGRKRIAAESQSIRQLLPSSGGFLTVSVKAGGTGYTGAPTVSVSQPDAWGVGYTNAAITATVGGGAVTGFTITVPGSGYVNPSVSISGGGGSGAEISWTLTPFISTNANQEVYNFADYASLLPEGVDFILAVQNVSVSWGGLKPTLRHLDWSGFQAWLRAYNIQSTNWPAVWAQYANGNQGSIYLNPIPSQTMQMEWDCYCIPSDLDSFDQTPEMLPWPWTEAVPYYAAHLACMSAKDMDMANYFEAKYKQYVKDSGFFTNIAVFPDFYESRIS